MAINIYFILMRLIIGNYKINLPDCLFDTNNDIIINDIYVGFHFLIKLLNQDIVYPYFNNNFENNYKKLVLEILEKYSRTTTIKINNKKYQVPLFLIPENISDIYIINDNFIDLFIIKLLTKSDYRNEIKTFDDLFDYHKLCKIFKIKPKIIDYASTVLFDYDYGLSPPDGIIEQTSYSKIRWDRKHKYNGYNNEVIYEDDCEKVYELKHNNEILSGYKSDLKPKIINITSEGKFIIDDTLNHHLNNNFELSIPIDLIKYNIQLFKIRLVCEPSLINNNIEYNYKINNVIIIDNKNNKYNIDYFNTIITCYDTKSKINIYDYVLEYIKQ
jgi:hypothetical protein